MKKRNYKREYKKSQGSAAEKKRRAGRNAARSKMESLGQVNKGDGKDVRHKDGNPTNNRRSNLRVTSRSKNRSRKK